VKRIEAVLCCSACQACDIPQAILPGPFNQSKEAAFEDKAGDHSMAVFCEPFNEISETIAPEPMITDQSREYLPAAIESQMLSTPSHLRPSFNRHFSQKTFSEEEKVQLLASPVPSSVSPSGDLHNEHLNEARTAEFPEFCSKFNFRTNLDIESERARQLCIPYSKFTSFNPLPSQPINPEVSADVYTSTSPKCKPDSSVDKLLLETPAQSTPRRAMHSSDEKHKDTTGQKQTLSCKPAKRVLDFSYIEADKGASEYYEFLHDSSTQPLAGSSSPLKKVCHFLFNLVKIEALFWKSINLMGMNL
jgi:chromatin licensing and DNA replication factor 1